MQSDSKADGGRPASASADYLRPDADFIQRFVDFGLARTSFEQRTLPPITALVPGPPHGRRCDPCSAAIGAAQETPERSTASDRREVAMTMSEYEERFRPPGPSLHQTYAATRGRNAGRRRRIWLVAAAVGVL